MKKIFSIFAALLFAGSMMADVTVSKSVHDLYPDDANGNQRGTLYSDAVLSISVNTDGNNGKVYSNGTEWRLYESANAVMKVEVKSGTIKTITFEYGYSQAGVLNYGSTVMTSKEAVTVNAAKAEFTVTHSSGDKKGIINIKSFTVVYGEGGTQDYCHVTSTSSEGHMPFEASVVQEEGNGRVIVAMFTNPKWIDDLDKPEPTTDGLALGMEIVPLISKADLRGKYELSNTDVVKDIYVLVKDGTLTKYAPKSGWFAIWLNEDEDGYDLEYELVVTVEGKDNTVAGNVYGICDDNMDINYCHVTSEGNNENMNFNAAAAGMLGSMMFIAVTTTPNTLVGDWTGDGVGVTFLMAEVANRKDLRGEYTIDKSTYGAILSAYENGIPTNASANSGSFTISLDKNKTTYDLAYDLTFVAGEESFNITGTINGICDKEMDIKTALENIPTAKVNGNKVIRNGHLFIEHEGHIYNANGVQVQ